MEISPQFPRVALAHLPTTLELCPGLTSWLDGPQVWLKRDDLTGLGGGGNKLRKLEFLLADAARNGADTVLTGGGVQSNHVRQTAAACAKLGLSCRALLEEPAIDMGAAFQGSGNLLLDRWFGAELRRVPSGTPIDRELQAWAAELTRAGARPYVVPVGGSNAVGALGYVNCAYELLEQVSGWPAPPAALVVATGSAGTQAGLLAGLHIAGASIPVVGVCVSRDSATQEDKVARLVEQTLAHLDHPHPLPAAQILTYDEAVGPGYGQPTEAMVDALRQAARRDGLLLDPVYTGKAFAGLVDLIRAEQFESDERVVFVHTGGSPALYAYPFLTID